MATPIDVKQGTDTQHPSVRVTLPGYWLNHPDAETDASLALVFRNGEDAAAQTAAIDAAVTEFVRTHSADRSAATKRPAPAATLGARSA